MQLIKPSQISGEIMTLIEETDKKVVLISPYFKVNKWYKFLNKLDVARQRNIEIEIYVRQGEFESVKEVLETGFEPNEIPNLHTKLYLNEKYAIVSSMNLLLSSDTNSLDIALKTENQKEYEELLGYYDRYIKNSVSKPFANTNTYYDWREELGKGLCEALNREVNIRECDGKLQINTSNRYEAFIANERTNDFAIFGILSGKEFDCAGSNQTLFQNLKMEIEFLEGTNGHYDTIWGIIKGIRSRFINDLKRDEEKTIVDAIVKFIVEVEQLKQTVR